jgi:hypothetical protein
VCPRAGLDDVERRKIWPILGLELCLLGCPAHSKSFEAGWNYGIKQLGPILKYYFNINLEGQRKTMKSHRIAGFLFKNPGLGCKPGVLTIQPQY